MPGQKRKYNVRFPPGRIKKIMQTDTEVGRMATAVPVLIAKTLEMFLKSLLTKTSLITQSKNSRVLSINHMKQCIESEKLFDFLKELAVQACSSSAAKESKSKGKCLGHRKKWHMSIKTKSPEKEELPKRCNTEPPKRCNTEPPKRCNTEPPKRCNTEPSDSSSESELVICLETPSP